MKRTLLALIASVVLALALAAPGAADHTICPVTHDPEQPGHSEFAKEHIVPLAHLGVIGQGHKPGTHQGFAGCHPEENTP